MIKIGFLGSFTEGKYSDWGINGRDGAFLAVDEINKNGGINGRRIELVIKDDRHDPVLAKKLIDEFVEEEINIVIGPVISSIAVAIVPYAGGKGVLLISPSASTDELTALDDLFIRVTLANSFRGIALADYIFKKKGWRNISVIIDENNLSYSASLRDAFITQINKLGGRILSSSGFKYGGNYAKTAAEHAKKKPDCIFIISGAIDTAALSQAVKKINPGIHLAADIAAKNNELLINGGDAVEGIIILSMTFDEDHGAAFTDFKKRFAKSFGNEPSYSVIYGYDAASVFLRAVEKEKSARDVYSIRKRILEISKFSGPLGEFYINQYGDVQRPITVVTVKNGKFVKAKQ